MPFRDLSGRLAVLAQQGLYRSRRVLASPQATEVVVDGHTVTNFCSNDYLGLANHPAVARAFKNAVDAYGVGSGAAHLVCGHSAAHHALEEELAAFTGRSRALLFSTGYMANLGVIAALVGRGDTVLEDRLNHASLLDGGLASGAKFKRYAHADTTHLTRLLTQSSGDKLVVTDGLFSMDGDAAPLPDLVQVTQQYGAWLMVDDAHGLGVLGANGGGLLEQLGLSQTQVPVLMGTLGKALGTFGAFVAGSDALIETLVQKARTYIYTTALPPAIAEATRVSLKLARTESWRRDRLHHLIMHFRNGAAQLGLTLLPSASPIQPLLIGDSQRTMALSETLLATGFWVAAIRPPTVAQGTARLRITLSAEHSETQIDQLLAALDAAKSHAEPC